MSRFGRSSNDSAWTDAARSFLPNDFSTEEAEFARQLRGLFAPEQEDLPPLYISTLLDAERHVIAEPAFEQKLAHRVFCRLRLPLPCAWKTSCASNAINNVVDCRVE